ncbi:MAG: S9 family peptidase, partial [Acidobacteria bacterium]|nr:S9 family peptidase [Acidobacteriota bacterium]
MMCRASLAAFAVLVVCALEVPRAASAAVTGTLRQSKDGEKRPIAETDLLKFTWIADPQVSPDGSTVVFVRVSVNERENRYETSLYAVSTRGPDQPRRLTSNIRDTSPRWAPDGKRIAFIRSLERNGRFQPGQIYLLNMRGGEARPLTSLADGATAPAWSPDGSTIAFTSSTGPDAQVSGQEGQPGRDPQDSTAPGRSDVIVVTRPVYRANGNPGYVDDERHAHIFTIAVSDGAMDQPQPKQLTSGDFDEGGAVWAPDGSSIYFTSDRAPNSDYLPDDADLYRVPASGGPIEKVASIDGRIGTVSPSPDGKHIAFVGTLTGKPVRSYDQPDLFVTDATPGSQPKNLTANYDYDVSGGIGGDQAAPRGENRKPIVWSRNGSPRSGSSETPSPVNWSLIIVSAEKGSSNLKRVSIASGAVDPVTDLRHDIVAFSASADASTIAATLSTQTNIGDIFVVAPGAAERDRSAPRQITRVNEALFKDIGQSEPEEIWFKTFDGKDIQGWILKPPDFDPRNKYPLILEIHGGPH